MNTFWICMFHLRFFYSVSFFWILSKLLRHFVENACVPSWVGVNWYSYRHSVKIYSIITAHETLSLRCNLSSAESEDSFFYSIVKRWTSSFSSASFFLCGLAISWSKVIRLQVVHIIQPYEHCRLASLFFFCLLSIDEDDAAKMRTHTKNETHNKLNVNRSFNCSRAFCKPTETKPTLRVFMEEKKKQSIA